MSELDVLLKLRQIERELNELRRQMASGDMLKDVYDADEDGKVDAAQEADHAATADSALTAESVPWSGVTGKPAVSPFSVMADFLSLPGLRGFWPMSSMNREGAVDSGRAIDMSGQGRHLDMRLGTYANFGITGNLAPIATLSEGYLIRANEAGLNGFGLPGRISEGYLGMTVGGWFRIHADRPEQAFISKWTDGSETWILDIYSTNVLSLWLKPPSVAPITVANSLGVGVNVWIFGVARWTRGTEIAVFQNGTKATNTIGVPTELPSTTSPLVIGATDSGANRKFLGDVSLCFLCDFALPDSVINRLYQNSRHLFGV